MIKYFHLVIIALALILFYQSPVVCNHLPQRSVAKVYLDSAKTVVSVSPDTTIAYAFLGLKHVGKKQESVKGDLYYIIGKTYYFGKTAYDSALKYTGMAQRIYFQEDSMRHAMNAINIQAYAESALGNDEKAITLNQSIIRFADSLHFTAIKAHALDNVGEIYRLRKNGEKAVSYLEQAKELVTSHTKERLKLIITLNLALAFDLDGMHEKAVSQLLNVLHGNYRLTDLDSALIYHNLGRIYSNTGRYRLAEAYLDSAMGFKVWRNSEKYMAASYKELVTLYNESNRPKQALPYVHKLYKLAHEIGNQAELEDATRDVSETYKQLNEYDSAYNYQKKYIAVISKIYDSQTNKLMAEMDAKYQTSEKEKEVIKLEAKQKLSQQAKKALLAGFILLFIISALIITVLRLRIQKKNVAYRLKHSEVELKDKQLELKQQQLMYFTQVIREKNKLLETLQDQKDSKLENLDKLAKSIILTEEDWLTFKEIFTQVHKNFFTRLRLEYPDFTENDIRISALMKLNLTNKEIANMLGISVESVIKAKYRLKKKIGLSEDMKLENFVAEI